MSHPAPPPTREHPTEPAAPPAPPTEMALEHRLALIDAAMTVRLDHAELAYAVNTAHIPTEPVDLADVVTVPVAPTPVDPAPPAPTLYPTPVAALLQRAHHRLVTSGWCNGALTDDNGACCMLGAIRSEARGHRHLENTAVAVLMDTIRRKFGDDVDSVPAFNDAFARGRIPARMVEQAASLADARGL